LAEDFDRSRLWPVIIPNDVSYSGESELETYKDYVGPVVTRRIPPRDEVLRAANAYDVRSLIGELWRGPLSFEDDGELHAPLDLPAPIRAHLQVMHEANAEAPSSLDEALPTQAQAPIRSRLIRDTGEAIVAQIPAGAGEEALAVLGWGGWNACPEPAQHVAILRYWRDRYGAVLQAMSHDTLELVVSHPPRDFDEAVPLARDQYAYASDIVDQGEHPTIGCLASALVGSHRWYFWWD
jgi:hypothetical protein